MMRSLISKLSIALATTSCAVGPDYVRPQAPVNETWSEGRDPRLATNTVVDAAWWTTFADPTLDKLIDTAHHQNLSLQVAGLRILEARAQLGVAAGLLLPQQVGPTARAAAVGISKRSANSQLLDRNYGDYQVGFDALWEIDVWGKFRRGVRAADADYLASVADYDDAVVALNAEVARTYVVIRTFEMLLDLARQNVTLQESGLDIAESRFKNGATSELDVAQAKSLLESTRSSIPGLQISLRQAQNALSTLLGRPTGFVMTLITSPQGIPTPPAKVAIGVPAEVLRRRPDIRGAELRAIAQCQRIGMARSELYPRFTLFGLIGTQASSGNSQSTIGDLFGPGSLVYDVGGSLFWPIFNYKRLQNAVRAEDARFQQFLVQYVNTVLTAAREVEDGMVGYLRQQDAAVFAQNAVTASELAVKIALTQYREGAVDYQRVLDTQRVLLASQNRLVDTRSSAATYLIALYKALGGGWEVRQGAPVIPQTIQNEMKHRTNWGSYLTKPQRERPPTNPTSPSGGK